MGVRGRILFFRPRYDLATSYTHRWLDFLVARAGRLRLRMADLSTEEAGLEGLTRRLEELNPGLLIAATHGEQGTLFGQEDLPVLRTCDNRLLVARVVYALSCKTSAELGPDAVGKGCIAYVGYDRDFLIAAEEVPPADLAEDKYARAFMESSNAVAATLIDGQSASSALLAGLEKFDLWLDHWVVSKDPYASLVVAFLAHDRDSLKLDGSEEAVPALAKVPILQIAAPILLGTLLILLSWRS